MAEGIKPYEQAAFTNAAAGIDHTSDDTNDPSACGFLLDLSVSTITSMQMIWRGLTGTVDCRWCVEVSNNGINWDEKKKSTWTAVGTDGSNTISLNLVLSSKYYRVHFFTNSVTGGFFDVLLYGK